MCLPKGHAISDASLFVRGLKKKAFRKTFCGGKISSY